MSELSDYLLEGKMIAEFIITFRETLEAALIVGIILSYLVKTKETKYNKIVYLGVGAGILASIIGAFAFHWIAGGFTGQAEAIFEGVTMLIGAGLLTWMILWMMQQKKVAQKLKEKVAFHISKAMRYELFLLVFVAVLREGIETVIFLNASAFASEGGTLVGALLGIIAALMLGYAIFVMTVRVNLKRFFNITSVILILFAAGLVAHGIHELQEAQVVPIVAEHIWDINPAVNADGSYPLLHEKGYVGSIMKGLFGYNGNPNLLEVVAWITYLFGMCLGWAYLEKKGK
jgi:high-affinity iron transporter